MDEINDNDYLELLKKYHELQNDYIELHKQYNKLHEHASLMQAFFEKEHMDVTLN